MIAGSHTPGSRWNDELDGQVVALVMEGSRNRVIASLLSIMTGCEFTHWMVRAKVERLLRNGVIPYVPRFDGPPDADWTPEKLARMEELRATKMPDRDIALELGVTHRAYRQKVGKLGLPRRKPIQPPQLRRVGSAPKRPELDALVKRLWNEGHSAREIGLRCGVSKNSVIGRAHRLKLASRRTAILSLGWMTTERRALIQTMLDAKAPPSRILNRIAATDGPCPTYQALTAYIYRKMRGSAGPKMNGAHSLLAARKVSVPRRAVAVPPPRKEERVVILTAPGKCQYPLFGEMHPDGRPNLSKLRCDPTFWNEEQIRFCHASAPRGSSYCQDHARVCFSEYGYRQWLENYASLVAA